eukprot:2777601-Pleurochrysis_carterae.AAC.1
MYVRFDCSSAMLLTPALHLRLPRRRLRSLHRCASSTRTCPSRSRPRWAQWARGRRTTEHASAKRRVASRFCLHRLACTTKATDTLTPA